MMRDLIYNEQSINPPERAILDSRIDSFGCRRSYKNSYKMAQQCDSRYIIALQLDPESDHQAHHPTLQTNALHHHALMTLRVSHDAMSLIIFVSRPTTNEPIANCSCPQ